MVGKPVASSLVPGSIFLRPVSIRIVPVSPRMKIDPLKTGESATPSTATLCEGPAGCAVRLSILTIGASSSASSNIVTAPAEVAFK